MFVIIIYVKVCFTNVNSFSGYPFTVCCTAEWCLSFILLIILVITVTVTRIIVLIYNSSSVYAVEEKVQPGHRYSDLSVHFCTGILDDEIPHLVLTRWVSFL